MNNTYNISMGHTDASFRVRTVSVNKRRFAGISGWTENLNKDLTDSMQIVDENQRNAFSKAKLKEL